MFDPVFILSWISSVGLGKSAPPVSPAPPSPDPYAPADISYYGLALAAVLVSINGAISAWLRLGLHGWLALAAVRCILQLSALGFVLVPIFNLDDPRLSGSYCMAMLVVASAEAVSRAPLAYDGMLSQVLAALALSSSTVIAYGLTFVIGVRPWWSARYLIPMHGMLLGNACSGVAVGLSAVLEELSSGRDKVEALLSVGATRWEATREPVQRAARLALLPLLNQMSVVGVSNYLWGTVLCLGGLGFLLTGLSSFFQWSFLPFVNSTTLQFFPQGGVYSRDDDRAGE
jgi:putative ABC transport system permease protein